MSPTTEVSSKRSSSEKWAVMQAIVGMIVILGFFANQAAWMVMLAIVPQKTFDPAILAIVNQLTGAAATLAGVAVNYYFGSSKGSKDKDDAMADSLKTSATAVANMATGTGNGTVVPKPPTNVNPIGQANVTAPPTK